MRLPDVSFADLLGHYLSVQEQVSRAGLQAPSFKAGGTSATPRRDQPAPSRPGHLEDCAERVIMTNNRFWPAAVFGLATVSGVVLFPQTAALPQPEDFKSDEY